MAGFCGVLTLFAWPVRADLWSGFYVPTTPRVTQALTPTTACVAAILDAQERYQIPDNLLLAIGIQEAGRQIDGNVTVWPWAVNAEGTGVFFPTREQAIGWVRAQRAQGVHSIDVGCMQINLHWHKGAFRSLDEAFDPVENAQYAAQFLQRLRVEEGSWWAAAGSYHSRTAALRDRYLTSLTRNHQVAKAEYQRLARLDPRAQDRLAVVNPSDLPKPPVLWGDTAQETSGFSIYSRQPLGPVLPVFLDIGPSDE